MLFIKYFFARKFYILKTVTKISELLGFLNGWTPGATV